MRLRYGGRCGSAVKSACDADRGACHPASLHGCTLPVVVHRSGRTAVVRSGIVPLLGTVKRFASARRVWLAVVTVALVAAAGGAYFAYAEWQDRRRVERLGEVYRGLTRHLQGSDVAPVAESLRTILALSPDNAEAARRLADLTAGHATPGDTEIAALLLRDHL